MTTVRNVVRFWIPLSFTWFFMAAEGPFLHMIIARLDNAKYNLAAFGLAFVIAMLIESPVINLLSAGVALAKDRLAVERLKKFMIWMNVLVTVGMIIVVIPPVFTFISYDVIGLIPEIGERLYIGLALMIPWPGAIGIRRFYQGLLIRNNKTRIVAYGTVVRLAVIGISAVMLATLTEADGIVVGTASMSIAVLFETAATYLMARKVMAGYDRQEIADCEPPPSNKKIISFYTPLALTSTINFIMMPILSYFMNKAPDAIASLAVIPVINSFTFLFRSFGFSFQEVGIAFLGDDNRTYPQVKIVAKNITIVTTLVMALVVFTPLAGFVFEDIIGLTPELAEFARIPLMFMVVMPLTSAIFALQRAILIAEHQTIHVTIAALIEVSAVTIIMALLVAFSDINGAIGAGIAMTVARFFANSYTGATSVKVRKLWMARTED